VVKFDFTQSRKDSQRRNVRGFFAPLRPSGFAALREIKLVKLTTTIQLNSCLAIDVFRIKDINAILFSSIYKKAAITEKMME
jgi:hypothetical protein